MASLSIRLHFGMPFLSDMAGRSRTHHHTAAVVMHSSIAHALSCPTGGYPSIRHNEVRDNTDSLLTEVCHDVSIECNPSPENQWLTERPTQMTSHDSTWRQVDSGGGTFEGAFFDVRVFNPSAQITSKPHCPLLIDVTRWRRSDRTNNEFARWNTRLSLPLSCRLPEEWEKQRLPSTKYCHRCSVKREMCPTVR